MMGSFLHIDLCCGLGGWQAPFEESPDWRSVGLDIRDDLNADVVADVRSLPLREGLRPTLLTASPPCTEFSTANMYRTTDGTWNPDKSIWRACEAAAETLEAGWWVLENVAGAKHWMGQPTWSRHPWHLWGRFPPIDTGPLPRKGETWKQRPEETATVPYALADALRRSCEVFAHA